MSSMGDLPEAYRAIDAALDALPQPDNRCERDRWRIVSRVALEAAMPVIERDIRSRIAASLRRAAAGRREYAEGCDSDNPHLAEAHLRLRIAADCHESSAAIIEDPRHLLSVIPSWRWTPGEHDSIREGTGSGH